MIATARARPSDARVRLATVDSGRRCHGPTGTSRTDSPDLAGQYATVIYKELLDFRSGASQRGDVTLRGQSARSGHRRPGRLVLEPPVRGPHAGVSPGLSLAIVDHHDAALRHKAFEVGQARPAGWRGAAAALP